MFTRTSAAWMAGLGVALVLVGALPAVADGVAGCPGDCDCNGKIDFFDIDLLLAALGGEVTWADKYERKFGIAPLCDYLANADANGDGTVDFFDIDAFLALLGTTCETPPPMVLIPGGTFQMGDTFNDGDSNERPVHTVYLSPYYVDAYEVTNQQYAEALNWALAQGDLITVMNGEAGEVCQYGTGIPYCIYDNTTTSPPYSYSRITWNGSTFGVVAGKENHPMVEVSWYGAAAFCNWRSAMEGRPQCYDYWTWECSFEVPGYRLPTEAEWEKAARGGGAGHRFPWSDTDTIQHARANYYSWSNLSYDTSPTRGYHPAFSTGALPHTSPVGYFAPNGYGVYDVAGNAREWCHDWYSFSYYSSSPSSNPTGPATGTFRVYRGGSWLDGAQLCRVAARRSNGPTHRGGSVGFRCSLGTP